MGLFDKFKRKENAPEEIKKNETAKPSGEKVDLTKKINLAKEEVHKICLTKKPLANLTARVGLVLDYSGSMSDLYYRGTVQEVIEKMLPIAMNFDDDGSMEVWIFENGFHRLPDITLDNLADYVKKEITGKDYRMGGTNYAPVIKNVTETYRESKKGNDKLPAYVIYITDGDNSDKSNTDAAILEASKYPIFWQFVGVGNAGFDYLRKLDDMEGRYVDNADFFSVSEAGDITYEALLNEFPGWLANQKVKTMLL